MPTSPAGAIDFHDIKSRNSPVARLTADAGNGDGSVLAAHFGLPNVQKLQVQRHQNLLFGEDNVLVRKFKRILLRKRSSGTGSHGRRIPRQRWHLGSPCPRAIHGVFTTTTPPMGPATVRKYLWHRGAWQWLECDSNRNANLGEIPRWRVPLRTSVDRAPLNWCPKS